MDKHFLKSSFREKLIEHLFIGELLKMSWADDSCALEVAKPEVDSQGYDVIAEENGVVRHIQLKAAHLNARAAEQKVHIALASKPSGCIVWIYFDEKKMRLGPFLFFGGQAGERLPSLDGFRVAKHTKANSEGVKAQRPEIRTIPKSKFLRLESVEEVYAKLFNGPQPCGQDGLLGNSSGAVATLIPRS